MVLRVVKMCCEPMAPGAPRRSLMIIC
jgi:hypothetical protein